MELQSKLSQSFPKFLQKTPAFGCHCRCDAPQQTDLDPLFPKKVSKPRFGDQANSEELLLDPSVTQIGAANWDAAPETLCSTQGGTVVGHRTARKTVGR